MTKKIISLVLSFILISSSLVYADTTNINSASDSVLQKGSLETESLSQEIIALVNPYVKVIDNQFVLDIPRKNGKEYSKIRFKTNKEIN